MKSSVGLLLSGFLLAVLMKEAASGGLDPKLAKQFAGRTYLGALTCQGQRIPFPKGLIQKSEDCLLNKVQRDVPAPMFASKKAAAKAGSDPPRKGPTCELACIMQLSDMIDGEYKLDEEKIDRLIDLSFSKNPAHKGLGDKFKEATKECAQHLDNLQATDDERCSIMEPYATCVTNMFIKHCTKAQPKRGPAPQQPQPGRAAPLLNVGGLISLG